MDVLESGRGSVSWSLYQPHVVHADGHLDRQILSLLSNNDISLAYTQLGGTNGLHFLGSMRGVLAIGPDGVPAFDTLSSTSFTNGANIPGLFYNYTLELQGITSNVSCEYDSTSPIEYFLTSSGLWQYNATCPPGQDVLVNATFLVPPSSNSLGFWACQTSAAGDSYRLYLRGSKNYAQGIGNITCTLLPFKPAVYALQYTGQAGTFDFTPQVPISTAPGTSTELLKRTVMGLGSNIVEAQSITANLVAESVITYGVKSFGLQPYVQDEQYLRLYEAMIRGVLDYEVRAQLLLGFMSYPIDQATYIRLIYSTKISASGVTPAPSSCLRVVDGSADVEVFGWIANHNTAAYLIPITFINLTTLVVLIVAMRIEDDDGRRLLPRLDPTDPETLIFAIDTSGTVLRSMTVPPHDRKVWKSRVVFGRSEDGRHKLQILPKGQARG